MYRMRTALLKDALHVGRNLRGPDRREARAATGMNPHDAVIDAFLKATKVWALSDGVEDKPVALLGIASDPNDDNLAIVWLLATPKITSISLSLTKTAPTLAQKISKGYRAIHNIVMADNDLHMRWLKRAGFQTGNAISVRGTRFIPVIRYN